MMLDSQQPKSEYRTSQSILQDAIFMVPGEFRSNCLGDWPIGCTLDTIFIAWDQIRRYVCDRINVP